MQDSTDQISDFKKAMGNYPTGVNVITTTENGQAIGLTVNSFASVSLEPLLILWSIDKSASTYGQFMKTDKFAVNILAEDQATVATAFAGKKEDRFNNCNWEFSSKQLPIISGTMAALQCHVFKRVDAGDHIVFIGEVFHLEVREKAPLLYHKRKMGPLPTTFHSN